MIFYDEIKVISEAQSSIIPELWPAATIAAPRGFPSEMLSAVSLTNWSALGPSLARM